MKRRLKAQIGDLIKVPFTEQLHTYARVLIEDSYAFYDCPSAIDRSDFETIIHSDILFITHVEVFAVKEGFWTIIKNIPLEDRLKNFYPRYFNPTPSNPVNKGFYDVYREEIEEAITKDWVKTGKLQLDGIYGNVHIEARLRDYYSGRIYEQNTIKIKYFKKSLGIVD